MGGEGDVAEEEGVAIYACPRRKKDAGRQQGLVTGDGVWKGTGSWVALRTTGRTELGASGLGAPLNATRIGFSRFRLTDGPAGLPLLPVTDYGLLVVVSQYHLGRNPTRSSPPTTSSTPASFNMLTCTPSFGTNLTRQTDRPD